MRLYSNRDRPFHLGPLALEKLRRIERLPDTDLIPAQPVDLRPAGADAIDAVLPDYLRVFSSLLQGPVAPARAPIPADPQVRLDNLKAAAYFLDVVAAAGCALLPDEVPGHTHALVFLVEFAREPQAHEPGAAWIHGSNALRTDVRVAENAAVLAGYLRNLGFAARGHVQGAAHVDPVRLALRAGAVRQAATGLEAPFLQRGFRIGVVTTNCELAVDLPLATDGALEPTDSDTVLGVGGTRPSFFYHQEALRPLHLGRWPMDRIPRVALPTTQVFEDDIRRVPKRGDFFKRAQAGDLGEKSARELKRFAMKHPLALAMAPLIGAMVPMQGTREPLEPTGTGGDLTDPRRNAEAIKALAHYLGADFVGVCRAAPWMYYSHDEVAGQAIRPYHKFAVVLLIDQGFETMDGASGDDWISATTSMRAYLRGAEIAGILAAHCRRMGFSARAQSNAHSEIIHNPAILMAGLGEVSRIGETILNPFIGPRSKSVVVTTDLPLAVDLPIDFGLQDFCGQCRKCARECPCGAITEGAKVMFNGYEIWKADVEKCTRYRVNNLKGSACGRCMKMCPWNREDTAAGEQLAWLGIEHPAARPALIAMDDAEGHGNRNLVKRWWFDLEMVDGVAVRPPGGVNARDLDLDNVARPQKLGMYPPSLQPPAGSVLAEVHPTDRAAAVALYQAAETPDAARLRRAVTES